MEKFLRKCLDSLILDNELMNAFEVLVVNDGSTDHSSIIAHEYECLYPKTFKVIDKENGHYGSCVNRGLKEARGEYVKILDADDYFDNIVFGKYLEFLSISDADMILTDSTVVNEKYKVKRKSKLNFPIKKNLPIDQFCMSKTSIRIQMHCVTYRRKNIIGNRYKQTEGVHYTDQEWMFLPIVYMNTFSYLPICLYRYLVGREGQSIDSSFYLNTVDIRYNLLYKRIDIYNNIRNIDNIDADKEKYLWNRLLYDTCMIIKNGIIVYKIPKDKIRRFMSTIDRKSPTLLSDSLSSSYSKYYGLKYVNYWLESGKIPLLVSFVCHLVNLLKYIC